MLADLPYPERLARRASALATRVVHAGDSPLASAPELRGLETPIVLSSAFAFASAEEAADAFEHKNEAYIYGRWGNPSIRALEAALAALEETEAACVTASGMAAVSGAVLSSCKQGAHVVAPRSMYAESARLLRERLPPFGITTTFVDATDVEGYRAAIRPETRLLYLETPANPNLAIADIAAIVGLARERGLVTLADNTFATPFSQNPHAFGVDLVLHSMTKALGGHGDAVGGCVCGRKAHIDGVREFIVKGMGGVLAPFNAFLVSRGLRTFALRQRQACESAAWLAERLAEHPAVGVVHHPSRPDHPGHALAARQMHAFGSLLSFELKGRSNNAPIDAGRGVLARVRVMTHAVSLGDVRTLIVHPASTTHHSMPEKDRKLAHITDGLLRVSVGIESKEDLWDDLSRALPA